MVNLEPQKETRQCKCCVLYYKLEAFRVTSCGRRRYICIRCEAMRKHMRFIEKSRYQNYKRGNVIKKKPVKKQPNHQEIDFSKVNTFIINFDK